jgi:translation initiation factor 5B
MTNKLRQPIVTVCGHVDHGKTSILDRFRNSQLQEKEAGGITQKISFTKYPFKQIKETCPAICDVKIDFPGFLFIDTPGHAAFTNLRKRGGSLADLAILVVSIKEGIKPQTAEVLQILKANKTPFLIALNKVDSISGWKKSKNLKESIESQPINVKDEFETALLTFEGALSQYGFESDLFYEIDDFTKRIAIVPCSAKTGEGIPELLYVLCGLCQRFLKENLVLSEKTKGIVLEIKKEKTEPIVEAILYDGTLKEGDEIAVASLDSEPIITKVRGIEEIEDLTSKYKNVKFANAATGLRLHLTNKEEIVSGMPFQKIDNDLDKIKAEFKKEITNTIETSKQGIIAKADSLGSLEALLTLLKQANISVVKADIGNITKSDIISAKANLEINPLDAIIIGFNVEKEEELEASNIKIITDKVVYKLIENLELWRKQKQAAIEREKLMELSTIFKLEILHKYVFRNSNPAIFGVKVIAGKAKTGIRMITEDDEEVNRIKSMQNEKKTVEQASENAELAISITGTTFDRKLGDKKYLYSDISEKQFKILKKNKELLSNEELKVIQEIAEIKRKRKELWGK